MSGIVAPPWVRKLGLTSEQAQAQQPQQAQQASEAGFPRRQTHFSSPDPPSFQLRHHVENHSNRTHTLPLRQILVEVLDNAKVTKPLQRTDSQLEVLLGWALAGAISDKYGEVIQNNTDWISFCDAVFSRQIDPEREFEKVIFVKWYPHGRGHPSSTIRVNRPWWTQVPYEENEQFFQEYHRAVPGFNLNRRLILPCSYIVFMSGLGAIKRLFENHDKPTIPVIKVLIPMSVYWFVVTKGVGQAGVSLKDEYQHHAAGWERFISFNASNELLGMNEFGETWSWFARFTRLDDPLVNLSTRAAEWWVPEDESRVETKRLVIRSYLIAMFSNLKTLFSEVSSDIRLRTPRQASYRPHGTSHTLSHTAYHLHKRGASVFSPVAR
ncbi:hypothetical protein JCM5350_000081 [Sporobolomyces pararoseus]